MKNLHGKMRNVDSPYITFVGEGPLTGWEWRVLKRYQSPDKERDNVYARWLVAVKSPMTWDSWEYGDTYIKDIPGAVAGQDFPDGVS